MNKRQIQQDALEKRIAERKQLLRCKQQLHERTKEIRALHRIIIRIKNQVRDFSPYPLEYNKPESRYLRRIIVNVEKTVEDL